jgi:hypothetical protein
MRLTQKRVLPTTPTEYPVGTFVESEKGYFLIAKDSKRYRILSTRILDSWRPLRIAKTTEKALAKYRIAAKLKFRNGSLIHNLADGRIYLIVDGKRHPVVSPDVLERIGAVGRDIVTVSKQEVEMHPLGEEIK